jgi:four helix bundle protein
MGEKMTLPCRVRDFKQLNAWQKGRELAVEVYQVTASFPPHERFGLAGQMQRAAVSIASNIAEGYGRGTRQEYLRALRIARGSLCELETQSIIAQDLMLIPETTPLWQLLIEEHRLLFGLIRSLENTTNSSTS